MKPGRFSILLLSFLFGCMAVLITPSLPPITLAWLGITSMLLLLINCLIRNSPFVALLAIFFLGFFYFSLRLGADIQQYPTEEAALYIYEIDLTIKSYPKQGERQLRFTATINTVSEQIYEPANTLGAPIKKWQGLSINLSCYACEQQFYLGERWRLKARLRRVHGAASWGAFDYERWALSNHLVAQGVIIEPDSAIKVSDPNWFNEKRMKIRQVIENSGINLYSQAVFVALSIGDRSLFNPNLWQFLKATGLGHIVAISGLHVGFIFVISSKIFRFLFNRFCGIYLRVPAHSLCSVMALLVSLTYCVLAGFSFPTQRAFLMLLIFCCMQMSLREISGSKALLFAFAFIVIFDPNAALSLSLWMSVCAVAIILLIIDGKPKFPLFSVQVSLSLAMAVLSLIIMANASLIAPLANIIVVPLVGFFVLPMLLVIVCAILLGFESFAVVTLKALDYGGVWLYRNLFSYWLVPEDWIFEPFITSGASFATLGLVCLITLFVLKKRLLVHRSFFVLVFLCLFANTKPPLKEGEFMLTVLDVGQALAIVIELKDHTLLFDTGNRFPTSDSALTTIIPYLRYQGVREVSHLLVSHHDSDHIGGLQSLLNSLSVKRVLSSSSLPRDLNINIGKSQFSICQSGQSWHLSGVHFEIFSPMRFKKNDHYSENNRSCVLKISGLFGSALLTGDIERSIEHRLISRFSGVRHKNARKLNADLLVLPHHGSKTSSSPSFLNIVKPKLAISSAGYLSRYGHPHAIVQKRLVSRDIKHMNTAYSGSVRVLFLEQGIEVKEYRKAYLKFWR